MGLPSWRGSRRLRPRRPRPSGATWQLPKTDQFCSFLPGRDTQKHARFRCHRASPAERRGPGEREELASSGLTCPLLFYF